MAEYSEDKRNKNRIILIVLVLLLLLFNAFLLMKFMQKKDLADTLTEELVDTKTLKDQLKVEVDSFKMKVAEYQGTILEQDSTLIAYKSELELKIQEIETLIKQDKITKSKYNKALEEIKKLEYYTKKYQDQIESLKAQNELLTKENEVLKTEVTGFKKEVDVLKDDIASKDNTINLAAMLKTSSITTVGLQKRKSGKVRETDRGDKMEGLKISFTIKENDIAKKNKKQFYIKVINPKSETLYLEEKGSGNFTYQGAQSPYTVMGEFEFVNDPEFEYSLIWDKGSEFEKGDYTIQIFNDGVSVGKGKFVVK